MLFRSTNMSKEDIDKAVKDAEAFAAEDKKKKEEVDVRNGADQMIFQSEKALADLGDKVSAEEKKSIEDKIAALKEALKGGNIDEIKSKQQELEKDFYAVSQKVYEQAQAAQAAGANPAEGPAAGSAPKDDGVVDADFTEVNDQ